MVPEHTRPATLSFGGVRPFYMPHAALLKANTLSETSLPALLGVLRTLHPSRRGGVSRSWCFTTFLPDTHGRKERPALMISGPDKRKHNIIPTAEPSSHTTCSIRLSSALIGPLSYAHRAVMILTVEYSFTDQAVMWYKAFGLVVLRSIWVPFTWNILYHLYLAPLNHCDLVSACYLATWQLWLQSRFNTCKNMPVMTRRQIFTRPLLVVFFYPLLLLLWGIQQDGGYMRPSKLMTI